MNTLYCNKIKRLVPFFFMALSAGFTACSDDDGEGGDEGGKTSPYWILGSGNNNMPSSGTIIAQYSDAPMGSDIGKLVDNNADTKYLTYHNSFDITWNGNSNVAVLSYSLTSAADAPEMDPKEWILYGSLDGKVWKTIDERRNQTFSSRKQVKNYEVENGVAYRYYKLSIQANHGGSATQLAEWVLSAATFSGNIDDLMGNASGHTQSTKTPMGTQHEGDLEATASDIAWLKDVNEEPDAFDNMTWKTFEVGSLYPFGDPKPADVNQHVIGDCSACAVMASMAHLYPKFIKNIIRDNGDQTYTVTLYDPKGEQVEVGVSNFFVADGDKVGAASGKNDQVTWGTILEKAIIKWHQIYKGTSNIGGIATEYVAAIITGNGNSFAFSPGKLSADELQRAVIVSLQSGKMVIGGFKDGDLPVDNTYKTVNFHAYSFYPSSNPDVLFNMRNPWGLLPLISGGYSNGKEDGLLPIKDDGVIPPNIDLRIMDPGAAKGYANLGKVEPYSPPSYSPSPMRISRTILQTGQ